MFTKTKRRPETQNDRAYWLCHYDTLLSNRYCEQLHSTFSSTFPIQLHWRLIETFIEVNVCLFLENSTFDGVLLFFINKWSLQNSLFWMHLLMTTSRQLSFAVFKNIPFLIFLIVNRTYLFCLQNLIHFSIFFLFCWQFLLFLLFMLRFRRMRRKVSCLSVSDLNSVVFAIAFRS